MRMNKRWNLQSEWRLGYNPEFVPGSGDPFGRYVDQMQWLFLNVGLDWRLRTP
ncbi:MAG: hypothetical protein IPN85_18915 [Flavobacteriales bacterium]|nr:hypothetical protein [Flavobacteriales bacterium]